MEAPSLSYETGHLEASTELSLGLPGSDRPCSSERNKKRATPEKDFQVDEAPPTKTQVVGWPPVRSYRKNCFPAKKSEGETGLYVKVSMDGAPYLRKMDINIYKGYQDLLCSLETMFKCTIGNYTENEGYTMEKSEFVPTYEDKDGDWMLVGDVPWDMFVTSCKRLRIMKGSEAKGLGS